jgi:cyclopropane-fatty-acyl-phospholipid synthase
MIRQRFWCGCIALVVCLPFSCSCQEREPDTKETISSSDPKDIIQEAFVLADVRVNGTRPWDIKVYNEGFYPRVLSEGSLGLGESYMDGWWDCESLDEFFYHVISANLDQKIQMNWQMVWAYVKAFMLNLQDKKGSMKVIDEHYQLGNELYLNMLDPSMGYSCGYWKDARNLHDAQLAKYDLICRKLGLKPGMKVLDIGCGFGGFAKHAAERYGVHVTGITLSPNQALYAREICAGLPVDIRVQDYRDITEPFDRVVEIGMFEHVGEKNYRTFMEIAHRCLKTNGLFMLHTIGSNESTCVGDPWISKYIFPNSHLPSIRQIGSSIEGLFVMEDWHNFGADYDTTLRAWFANFNAGWPAIKEQYGERFYRMWKYYLLSCAGAFRARSIQLWEVVLSKGGVPGGYETVR